MNNKNYSLNFRESRILRVSSVLYRAHHCDKNINFFDFIIGWIKCFSPDYTSVTNSVWTDPNRPITQSICLGYLNWQMKMIHTIIQVKNSEINVSKVIDVLKHLYLNPLTLELQYDVYNLSSGWMFEGDINDLLNH